MKIAVIGSKGLPPRQGGIEHHCAEIYSRIVDEGPQVTVFARSSYNKSSWNERYSYKNVEVINLPSISLKGIDALFNAFLATIIASFQQFDIIHFHALGPSLFSWIPRLLSPKTKVVVTCHGLDWQRAKWGLFSKMLLELGERIAVKSSHAMAVVSQDLQGYFRTRYLRQTSYIGNAPATYQVSDPECTFSRSRGLEQGKYIVFLGRLVPEKRPDLLIAAFQKLSASDWKLALVGGSSDTGSYRDELLALANSNPNILFFGELRGTQLAEIVRGAGFFVLPSKLEGLPLALLEAMQEGVPVVASDIPVHRQIIGKERGLLFEEGNTDDCADVLRQAIQSRELLKQRAQRGKRYIRQNHNWDNIARDWLTLYKKISTTEASTNLSKATRPSLELSQNGPQHLMEKQLN